MRHLKLLVPYYLVNFWKKIYTCYAAASLADGWAKTTDHHRGSASYTTIWLCPLGVERTEKVCVGSEPGQLCFSECAGMYPIAWSGSIFQNSGTMKTALIKKMTQIIWNKQLSSIPGPWRSIAPSISVRVLLIYYLTWPVRGSFHP